MQPPQKITPRILNRILICIEELTVNQLITSKLVQSWHTLTKPCVPLSNYPILQMMSFLTDLSEVTSKYIKRGPKRGPKYLLKGVLSLKDTHTWMHLPKMYSNHNRCTRPLQAKISRRIMYQQISTCCQPHNLIFNIKNSNKNLSNFMPLALVLGRHMLLANQTRYYFVCKKPNYIARDCRYNPVNQQALPSTM